MQAALRLITAIFQDVTSIGVGSGREVQRLLATALHEEQGCAFKAVGWATGDECVQSLYFCYVSSAGGF